MTFDAKRLGIAVTLLLLALGSWWLTRAVSVPEPVYDAKSRHDPDYTIENFTVTVMDPNGRRRYTLSAEHLTHYGDDDSADLVKPYLVQYRVGSPPVHTRADTGWLPGDRSELRLDGNVRSSQGRDPKSAGGDIRTDKMKIILEPSIS